MAERLFYACILTGITVLLFLSGIPELAAVGIFVCLFAIYAWGFVLSTVDRNKKRKSKQPRIPYNWN